MINDKAMPLMIQTQKKKKKKLCLQYYTTRSKMFEYPIPAPTFLLIQVDEFVCACLKKVPIFHERFLIGKLAKPNPRQPMAEVLQTCNHQRGRDSSKLETFYYILLLLVLWPFFFWGSHLYFLSFVVLEHAQPSFVRTYI